MVEDPPVERPRTGGAAGEVFQVTVGPAAKSAGYYVRSWRRYLSGDNPGDLPVARPTLALAQQAFRDEIVLTAFRMLRPTAGPEVIERVDQEVARAVDLFNERGWCEDPSLYLRTPPPPDGVELRDIGGRGPYQLVAFDSGYEPHPDEPGAERYAGYEANRQAFATMLRHREPRPWVVAVHGAGMGSRPGIDMALFRARKLHEDLGLNVLLPALPLHGPRRNRLSRNVTFPGQDLLDTVHAAAQAVWDVRRFIAWIRAMDGPDAPVGISGISLGGYVSSLVAGTETGLTCAILGVPVVDLVDLLDRHAGPAPTEAQRHSVELARRLGTVVSPLQLPCRVPAHGRFIYAGLADRLVHPRYQVARLWEHWDRPRIEWYEGGHTGFFRSRPVQDFVVSALVQSGLVSGHRS